MAPLPFWWVQPAVVSAGIIATLCVAAATILTNRRIARVKATLDMIEATESKAYYQTLYATYRRYRTDARFRDDVLNATDDGEALKNLHACWDYLNHYELIAIGCKKGILDEEFYRLWMGYAVLRDFREGECLIRKAREPGDDEAYVELEALCVSCWPAARGGERMVHQSSALLQDCQWPTVEPKACYFSAASHLSGHGQDLSAAPE